MSRYSVTVTLHVTMYIFCKQVKCFNAPLQPSEIIGVKRVVEEKLPEGVNDRGLTLRGFLFLHALFIEKGRLAGDNMDCPEKIWI